MTRKELGDGFFRGEDSQKMWDDINEIVDDDTRWAVYGLACNLQEFEHAVERALGKEQRPKDPLFGSPPTPHQKWVLRKMEEGASLCWTMFGGELGIGSWSSKIAMKTINGMMRRGLIQVKDARPDGHRVYEIAKQPKSR